MIVKSEQHQLMAEAAGDAFGEIRARIRGRPTSVEADVDRVSFLRNLALSGYLEARPDQDGFAVWQITEAGRDALVHMK
jgi:hypothetical protein